jgi:ribose-phosphate pyrophosphokinase
MEVLVCIDACKRASAGSINIIMPYYGYARQDRKAKPRQPITSKLVANLLQVAGASRILTFDLHAAQIQGYFDIPIDDLTAVPMIGQYFKEKNFDKEELVVVSPDHGGVTRARRLADILEAPIAIIDKRRPKPNMVEAQNVIGDVEGKNCIIVDDMIDTAGTICNAGKAIMDLGAKSVSCCATHAILSGPAKERLENSAFEEVVLLNTVPVPEEKQIAKMKHLSVAPLFAEAISRIHTNESVSKLFD